MNVLWFGAGVLAVYVVVRVLIELAVETEAGTEDVRLSWWDHLAVVLTTAATSLLLWWTIDWVLRRAS